MERILFLILLALPGLAFAACPDPAPDGSVCLEWRAPTQNTDGSPLTDLESYRIYYGSASREYDTDNFIPVPSDLTELTTGAVVVPNPGPGGGEVQMYFAMTALDEEGNESAYSNEVLKTIVIPDTLPPNPPTLETVTVPLRLEAL